MISGNTYVGIHQKSSYMVLPGKNEMLAIIAQYFINNSKYSDKQKYDDNFKQYVKVILYKLDDRGIAIAMNKYECGPKSSESN